MSRAKPFVADRELALTLGIIAYIAGSVLLWDAFEHRGRDRPFRFRVLSGLV